MPYELLALPPLSQVPYELLALVNLQTGDRILMNFDI